MAKKKIKSLNYFYLLDMVKIYYTPNKGRYRHIDDCHTHRHGVCTCGLLHRYNSLYRASGFASDMKKQTKMQSRRLTILFIINKVMRLFNL